MLSGFIYGLLRAEYGCICLFYSICIVRAGRTKDGFGDMGDLEASGRETYRIKGAVDRLNWTRAVL